MQFSETREQAAAFATAALEKMEQQGIPPTPNNFMIWYSYVSARDPALTKGMDALLKGGIEFTAQRNEDLYDKYIGFDGDGAEIRATSHRLQTMMNEVQSHLSQAGKDQSAYGETLASVSGQLGDDAGPGVTDLVRGLLAETRQIMEKNQALESRLGESSQQIESLREHLEEVQREALTDALTGIANRKNFDATLRQSAQTAAETGDGLCLLLTDIDHFKKFNDTYGHRVGDEVLRVVARTLTDGVKGRDTPARYGGEEFAVILPQTNLRDAQVVAEQIRLSLASNKLQNKKSGKSYGTVTLSIGVARFRPGESLDELIQRADEALYRAKGEGRNRVVVESAPEKVIDLAS